MAESTRDRRRQRRSEETDGQPRRDEEEERRAASTVDEEEERRDESATDEASDAEPRDEASEDEGTEQRLSARELTEAAAATIADLTGLDPESVTGLQWDGESWLVTVDVVEVARIPNTTDVLASYVVQLDDAGELLGYKRTRRFVRGQVDEG